MILPTFLICGAQRSGSTSLRNFLMGHPQIFFPQTTLGEDPVALKFFAKDFESEEEYQKELERYAANFESDFGNPIPGMKAWGEKSIAYMDSLFAAMRIRETIPNVQLLFILRNPIHRAYSHYRYSFQHCLESLPFHEALIMEPYRSKRTPNPLKLARPWSYVDRGMYAKYLFPFFNLFKKSQILIIFEEEIIAQPEQLGAEIFEFLGVSPLRTSQFPKANPHDYRMKTHVSVQSEMTLAEFEYLRERFNRPNAELSSLLNRPLPESWDSDIHPVR